MPGGSGDPISFLSATENKHGMSNVDPTADDTLAIGLDLGLLPALLIMGMVMVVKVPGDHLNLTTDHRHGVDLRVTEHNGCAHTHIMGDGILANVDGLPNHDHEHDSIG